MLRQRVSQNFRVVLAISLQSRLFFPSEFLIVLSKCSLARCVLPFIRSLIFTCTNWKWGNIRGSKQCFTTSNAWTVVDVVFCLNAIMPIFNGSRGQSCLNLGKYYFRISAYWDKTFLRIFVLFWHLFAIETFFFQVN